MVHVAMVSTPTWITCPAAVTAACAVRRTIADGQVSVWSQAQCQYYRVTTARARMARRTVSTHSMFQQVQTVLEIRFQITGLNQSTAPTSRRRAQQVQTFHDVPFDHVPK